MNGQAAALREKLSRMLASLGAPRPAMDGDGASELEEAIACAEALDAEIELMQVDASSFERRLAEMTGVIAGFVAFDYSKRASLSGKNDAIDGLAVCLNVLAEELGSSMVSKAYVNNIIESMHDPLLVLERDGRIKTANAAAARATGYARAELSGQPITLLFPEIQVPDILAKKSVVYDETRCRTKAEAAVVFSFTASVMTNRRGEFEGIVCVGRDRTEAKRAEEERIRSAEEVHRQAILLEELSTPLIPIAHDVIAMPVIGSLDQARARRMCEVLLRGVVSRRARMVILDITGVRIVDQPAVQGIVGAVQCLRLVGSEVILTGVRAEVAAMMVSLNMDFSGIRIASSFQSAIVEALGR